MITLVLIWNLLVFIMYGIDKIKAVNKLSRIPEWVLLFFAFLFGAAGAMFGMIVFNHKTSKIKFRILVPSYVLLNVFLIFTDYSALIAQIAEKIG